MTGRELVGALKELGLTAEQFARLSSIRNDRLDEMLKGKRDVPHWARLLCALLRMPNAMTLADAVTDGVVHDTEA
jgi:transcriptional regulator with XRE-family HTH domain